MFTPPPSPLHPKSGPQDSRGSNPEPQTSKHSATRHVRWTVLSVPLILVLITLTTRYITHPVALDALATSQLSSVWTKGMDWTVHQPHLHPRQATSVSQPTSSASSSAPNPTESAATPQPVPTVPSSPPPIPTPFPQPWEDMSQNFSSASCFNFFQNMSVSPSFRQCRPFSLLLQASSEMVEAQTNLTLMNNIIWGTCNTRLDEDQCVTNMSGFEAELRKNCEEDLGDGNTMAVDTLKGLQAFPVMHETGCLIDPTTNSYCFLDAVRNINPTDLYYYLLPLGSSLPKSSRSTCSACTKSLMSIYSASLDNSTEEVLGLEETYNGAAQLAITDCGQAYATLSGNANEALHGQSPAMAILLPLLFAISSLLVTL